MTTPAIELNAIRKRFKHNHVLEEVNLTVPTGETFAFLGRNAAGKTTTIRMMLGLIKPDGGDMHVLGLSPQKNAIEIRRRVGYLAEDQRLFGWMRVDQVISFMKPFYPTWDDGLTKRYTDQFELPRRTRVRNLSKGQNVRLGLLLALAHRPELVILDDPALGLDPIMRKEFNRDLVTHLQGEGRTVFYSSHLLYEVEPVADRVAILDRGRIVRCEQTERLREQVKLLRIEPQAFADVASTLKLLDVKHAAHEVAVVVDDAANAERALQSAGVTHEWQELNLDEIFEAFVIGRTDATPGDPQPAEAMEVA